MTRISLRRLAVSRPACSTALHHQARRDHRGAHIAGLGLWFAQSRTTLGPLIDSALRFIQLKDAARVQIFLLTNAAAPRVACPLYVQWPALDRVTCRDSALLFLKRSTASEVMWHELKDGALHVMWHGRRGPALVAAIRDWLLRHVGTDAEI